MTSLRRFAVLPLLFVLGCSASKPPDHPAPAPDWVGATLRQMSLEEKAAQMIVVWTPGRYIASDADQWKRLEHFVRERKIGGLVFSLGDVYEYSVQINRLQAMAQIPLLVAGDFEYGVAMRVRNSTMFPSAMAVRSATTRSSWPRWGMRTSAEHATAACSPPSNISPDTATRTSIRTSDSAF